MAVHNSTVKWGVCENSTVAIGYSYYELNLFSQWTFILKVLLSHTWKKDKEGNDKPPNCLHKRLPAGLFDWAMYLLTRYLIFFACLIWNTYYINICKFVGRFCVQSVLSSWQETYETAIEIFRWAPILFQLFTFRFFQQSVHNTAKHGNSWNKPVVPELKITSHA